MSRTIGPARPDLPDIEAPPGWNPDAPAPPPPPRPPSEPEPTGPGIRRISLNPGKDLPDFVPEENPWAKHRAAAAAPDPNARTKVLLSLDQQLLAAPPGLQVAPAGGGSMEPLPVVALLASRIGTFSSETSKGLVARPDAETMRAAGWIFESISTDILPVAIVGGRLIPVLPGEGKVELAAATAGRLR